MNRFHAAGALGAYACLHAGLALAQNPSPIDIRACSAIETDAQRLLCYDKATGRDRPPQAAKKKDEKGESVSVDVATRNSNDVARPVSLLDSRWELSPESKLGTFNLRGYQPIYILPLFATSDRNETPHSPNPNNTVTTSEPLDWIEAKFQLSFKTQVWQGVFGDAGDVWATYTQSSRWQLYNSDISRPFRETDYEPEVMLVFDTNYRALGWDGRLLGIGVNHQSNGRGDPLSRSWNRVIANVGFEREGWSVMMRPWWRINESARNDNNPDIEDYMGRGELQLLRVTDANEFGLLLRHSLRGGDDSRGSARFTWSFPMAGNLRGYLEAFTGYGRWLASQGVRTLRISAALVLDDVDDAVRTIRGALES
jgi:phospholipase A1